MNKRPCALPPLRQAGLPIVNRLCASGTESKRPLGQDRGGDEMDKDYE